MLASTIATERETTQVPSRIEIVTPNGHRVLVGTGVDETALARVLAALART